MTMPHQVVAMRYAPGDVQFQRVLRQRVKAYLATQPAGRRATGFMWFKVAFYIIAYWLVWAALALYPLSPGLVVGGVLALSMLTVGLAYNVSHDAVHGALAKRRWVNELLFQLTFTPLGPNGYLWRLRHTVMHHSCVNIPGWDFNIEAAAILRFSPTQPWRPIHRYQHLYAPIAYLFFTLHWVFIKDFQLLRTARIGNVTEIRHPWWRVVEVVACKLLYVGHMLVLPALVLDAAWWQVLAVFLAFQCVVSFQFVLTFTGSHLNQGMVFVEHGEDNTIPHSFLEHALWTSLDFNPTHPAVSFWLGGFNAHIAHHMFPSVCSVHYPKLTPIIRQTAAEFGLPYQQISMGRLFVRHFRYLAQLGADPTTPRKHYLHPREAA